jgi:hypothetical protein
LKRVELNLHILHKAWLQIISLIRSRATENLKNAGLEPAEK